MQGDEVVGVGASLRVLLHAFERKQYVWYSLVFGDVNDEVLVVPVERALAGALPRRRHSGVGPVAAALMPEDVEEYELTGEAQRALGVHIDAESSEVRASVRHWIYVHDDCFFSLEGADEGLKRQTLEALLEMHSFYLGAQVDWSGVVDEIYRLLEAHDEVTLETDPEAGTMTVRWRAAAEGLARLVRRFGTRQFRVENGVAV
jgi:hypothetical protein